SRDRIRPLVVESEAIDQRRLFWESKNARFRISGLRFSSHSADLNETKTERGQRGQGNAVLIETGGQSDRISKSQAESGFWFRRGFKKLQCAQGQIDPGSAAQECDREMMRRFRIDRKKKRPNESLVGIHSRKTAFQAVMADMLPACRCFAVHRRAGRLSSRRALICRCKTGQRRNRESVRPRPRQSLH